MAGRVVSSDFLSDLRGGAVGKFLMWPVYRAKHRLSPVAAVALAVVLVCLVAPAGVALLPPTAPGLSGFPQPEPPAGLSAAPLAPVEATPVVFQESGLIAGTNWSVTFAFRTESSTADRIAFASEVGTFPFTVGAVRGYNVSPASGYVIVRQAGITVYVSFTPVVLGPFPVTFNETGLPHGHTWSVTAGGREENSSGSSITFLALAGQLNYTVFLTGEFGPSPSSGSINVTAPTTVNVTFVEVFEVTFFEATLPAGTNWSVTLFPGPGEVAFAADPGSLGSPGITGWSDGSAFVHFEASNGTFNYSSFAPGYSGGSGAVEVTGGPPPIVSLSFAPQAGPFLGLTSTQWLTLAAALVVAGCAIAAGVVVLRRRRSRSEDDLTSGTGGPGLGTSEPPGGSHADLASGSAGTDASSGPPTRSPASPADDGSRASRAPWSPLLQFTVMRLALIPIQLVFVLLLLYVSIDLPIALAANPHLTLYGYFEGFGQMVTNIFTGNWGMGPDPYDVPWSQLYIDFLPTSIELALFALPIAAVIAYPLSLILGWKRRPAVDVPSRLVTLVGALLPVFIVGTLLIYALFFVFFNAFGDVDSNGIIPNVNWFYNHYNEWIPPWVVWGQITLPTGFPLIDGVIHQAWAFEAVTLTKTLIQATVIAIAYVAIFLRHARSLVASASQELHVTAARSRGVSEHTLLWRHTARRVAPTFLIVAAITIPGYLVTQFVVEALFNDPGVGWLTVSALTYGNLVPIEGLVFLLAAFILVAVLVVDLAANRLDPRGAVTR